MSIEAAPVTLRDTILNAVLIGAVTGGTLLGAGIFIGEAMRDAAPMEIPACSTEDDPGPCYWDADERNENSNGTGRSFVIIDSELTYLR